MKRIVLVILFVYPLLLSTHCKKETEDPFFFNSTFQSDNTVTVYPVRVFTRNGEITDTTFIKNFVTRVMSANSFPIFFSFNTQPQTQILDPYQSLKISFRDNYTASVVRYPFYFGGSLETHEADFNYTGPSGLLVVEKDTIEVLDYPGHCFDINTYLSLANPPVKTCQPVSNNTQLCKMKNLFPIKIDGDQLKLPMLINMTLNGAPHLTGGCLSARHREMWGTFNNNIINSLQSNDTIAIQLKEVILKKM